MSYLGAALKRRLYPTVCCYHGCVSRRADVRTFRESLADVRSHVRSLQQLGYRIVKPSEYAAWQSGALHFDEPVTCIHFDDGLASVELVVPWLIEQGIPCGLALITRRQRKVDAEPDFIRWGQVRAWVATGLVEILSHTHNLHHLAVIRNADSGLIDVAPVLEGPCWVDDGDVVYRMPGDARWYWDWSFVDDRALAIPIWGTDQFDGATPIVTTLSVTPKASGNVGVIRCWMALSRPYDVPVEAGYDANVVIDVRGAPTLAADPPADITPGLEGWFAGMTRAARTIVLIGDSTTEIAPALYNAFGAAIGELLPGTTVLNRGNDGKTAADWLAGSVPNPPALCYADAADLYIVSFGLNDVRTGACDEATLASRLSAIVAGLRTNVPGCSVILRMPNSMLSTDPTGSGWVWPLASAQAYTDIIRGAYLGLIGAWPDVAVWDAMSAIFGTTCPATSPLMRDILHPDAAGYTLIGEALAALVVPDGWIESGGTAWAQVWDGIVKPKQYATRAQWVAREFYSITLDTGFAVTAGEQVDVRFSTQNAGYGVAMLYALPVDDAEAFHAVSNCRGLVAEGTQRHAWQYVDYPAGQRYPLVPAIILGFGSGADATMAEYAGYVADDCAALNAAVDSWLNADWVQTVVYRPYSTAGKVQVIGWANPTRYTAVMPMATSETRTVEAIRVELGGTENFRDGDADEWTYGRPGNPNFQAAIDEALSRSYTAIFRLLVGDGATGPWTEIGSGMIYNWQRGIASDVTPFVLAADVEKWLRIETINGGWTTGGEQRCRWPVWSITALSRVPGQPPAAAPTQLVYPFGSYLSDGVGVVQQRPGFNDIAPELKVVFGAAGYDHAYTIQGLRNHVAGEFREPDLRQTEWALGRWLAYGDQAPDVSLNNLAALSGALLPDVPHRGVAWQASLEADPQGNASVRARPQALDFVAFDAWGFDGAGGIVAFELNDGGTYDGETYADDKGWLQARGVRCLLIINNNLGTGEPDADIASHVVNHATTYIPQIVAIAVDDGWDGITINLESVPVDDRAAATDFFAQLARALHAAGKLLHATVPAATGTVYDADWWVGWCDHGALAKVCDAIKVMSYTESGPGTDPGPAAPQWFWDAVYARMRAVVAEPYWPRVLCGCRAFGHQWTGIDAEYITYHQAIAGALEYGKRIDVRDTEIGWGTPDVRAWCGTPLTVDRAQLEALRTGFGGIGLWKLDDGDIEEFIPLVRQLGRSEDMSFLEGVTFPESVSRGSSGGPEFSTSVVETQSGDEARNGRRLLPLCRYDAAVGVRTQQMADAVRDVFMVARGKLHMFRYRDWQDYRLDDGIIGTADGVVTTFQLVKIYAVGAHSLTRQIQLPRDGTLVVRRNGAEIAGWTCNYATGLVSFATPPAAGVISASCEFDVRCRFDVDYLPTEIAARNVGGFLFEPGSIPLVERRA